MAVAKANLYKFIKAAGEQPNGPCVTRRMLNPAATRLRERSKAQSDKWPDASAGAQGLRQLIRDTGCLAKFRKTVATVSR